MTGHFVECVYSILWVCRSPVRISQKRTALHSYGRRPQPSPVSGVIETWHSHEQWQELERRSQKSPTHLRINLILPPKPEKRTKKLFAKELKLLVYISVLKRGKDSVYTFPGSNCLNPWTARDRETKSQGSTEKRDFPWSCARCLCRSTSAKLAVTEFHGNEHSQTLRKMNKLHA